MEAKEFQIEQVSRYDNKDNDKDKCDKEDKYDKHDKHDKHDKDKHKDKHPPHYIRELERTIDALADSLAHLGRGTHLHELLRIIRWPGWTTPAELAFVNTILEHIAHEVRSIERLQAELVEASRKVGRKYK